MTKIRLPILAFSLFVFFAGFGTVAAEEVNKTFHQSFDVKAGDTLCLRFGDGDVRLIPWEKASLDVNVRYRADIDLVGIRLNKKKEFDVEFGQSGNTIYVTGKEPGTASIGFFNERVYEYVYEIHSPDSIVLDLKGDDGDVDIENWAAAIECRVEDGDVRLSDIRGAKTTIRGEDGDIEVDNLSGDLAIDVEDGDVNLAACEMPSCRVESEDGNVVLKKIKAKGLILSSEDGDIEVGLLAADALDAEIKTGDGDINIDLEKQVSVAFYVSADDSDSIRIDFDNIEGYKKDKYTKSGSLNGGSGRLKVQTVEGDVTIKEGW